jgi:VanZ family protein
VRRFLISWGPTLLWAGLIFYFSSRTWGASPARFPSEDKVAHLVLFGVLGMALAWAGRHFPLGRNQFRFHVVLVFLGVLYAAADELHQSLVPLRDPSGLDLAADVVGIVLGYLLASALMRGRRQRDTRL